MNPGTLQNLFLAVACAGSFAAHAQNGKLQLNKGEKIQVENTLNSVATMEMMGQQMEMKSDAFMQHQVEVKDKKDTSYTIASKLTKMTTTGTVMEQSYSFDSDSKKDRDSSELGKMLKDQLNTVKEIELNNKGVMLVQNKTDTAAGNDENPMLGMMKTMTGTGTDFSNAAVEVFQVLPVGAKQGYSWSDSSIANGVNTHRTFTVKEINNNTAAVTLVGTQKTTKMVEQMGTEVNLTIDAKLSGESIVDVKTGTIQQKTYVIDGAGTADLMGQAMPLTMKVTSVTSVKRL